jgi:hypothetical protein
MGDSVFSAGALSTRSSLSKPPLADAKPGGLMGSADCLRLGQPALCLLMSTGIYLINNIYQCSTTAKCRNNYLFDKKKVKLFSLGFFRVHPRAPTPHPHS